MSQRSGKHALFHKLEDPTATDSPRTLILAAHPDDETIGGSCVLGRISDCSVVYLTDGAPRDPRWRSPHVNGPREVYARVRLEEAAAALALVGVPAERIMCLGAVDQEAIYQVQRLTDDFLQLVQTTQPDVIITHSYEGGHPDHDTAALVARLALRNAEQRLAWAPDLLEMTSYHAADGHRRSGEFLQSPTIPEHAALSSLTLNLSASERAIKARMLASYVSQWHVLSEFPLEPERLRVAPLYDFSQPPHAGQLWYECLQWPLTGMKWREMASAAVAQSGEQVTCR
jgi:N-acetylglucosamine malate deacetylase 2